ncbi:helix-turn-helix domain-containing protein [Streptomyces ipomoeae]|uniref:nSTAND1 domain-containing NTPase n=1 Tax=Streptomyces ipomoeae TaxID=103232 RepID=UPI00114670E3|nr:helix-turn-helix domain-containing protein [Streptomyces ipomoeae]MDX2935588.1 DNA-binding protein [Streptomyces ipomoeae]TQE18398.1 DNA-binding protein [Streptomyces ipomoeae]
MGRPEADLDPGLGPVQRFAFELRKLRQEAGGITYRQMARQVEVSVSTLSRAAKGEQLPYLPVVLAYVRACGGEEKAWERRWREAVTEQARAADLVADETVPSPYRGLARFDVGDAELFFGRDEMTDALVRTVAEHRVVAVFGPSGSGKSSLLRAGLIPRLRSLDGPDRPAAVRILTPGEHPLRTHDTVCVPAPGSGDTWLVVDQFEEIFTLCHDTAERAGFLARLLAAAQPGSRLRVVLGVRADFYAHCLAHPELAAAIRESTVPVGPMDADALRAVIVKPAQAHGLIVERALTARLTEQATGEPGSLPLLSHALLETWRRRRGHMLTLEAYEATGGIHAAIAQTAEDLYARLSPDQCRLVRRILLRLITPGDGTPDTRRPVERAELDLSDRGGVARVLADLAAARLVTLDDDRVDLAHESLISSWPRLRQWIEEDREWLRAHRRLTEAAQAWDDLGRDPGALYRGARLDTADELFAAPERAASLTSLERSFLATSREARTGARRRRRGLIGALSLLVVLSLVAGIVAWQQGRTSDRRHAEAEARRIAAVADGLRRTDPVAAIRLSVAAWRLADLFETRSALLAATAQKEQDVLTLPDPDMDSDRRQLTQDGRTLVSVSADSIQTWDLRSRQRTGRYRGPGTLLTDSTVVISPDGHRVAVLTEHDVQVWDVQAGRVIAKFAGTPVLATFSDDGRHLAVDDHVEVRIWDIHSSRPLIRLGIGSADDSTNWAISPDGQWLVACPDSRPVRVHSLSERRNASVSWADRIRDIPCTSSSFSPDGRQLALTTTDAIRRWDVRSGRELPQLDLDMDSLSEFRFSLDGRFAATISDDDLMGRIELWRLSDPNAPVFQYTVTDTIPSTYALDLGANALRYLSNNGSAVHSLDLGPVMTPAWRHHGDDQALFAPDGRTLAIQDYTADPELRLVDTRTGRVVARPPGHPCSAAQESGFCGALAAFSADGRYFAYTETPPDTGNGSPARQRIAIWDVAARRKQVTLDDPRSQDGFGDLGGLALDAKGSALFAVRAGTERSTVQRWDVRQRKLTGTPVTIAGDGIEALSPDSRTLVSNRTEVVTLPSGPVRQRLLIDEDTAALAFSPDGTYLAVGDGGGQVVLWDAKVRTRVGVLSGSTPGSALTLIALAFSPDSRLLAVGDDTGAVQLWDVASAQRLGAALPTPGDGIRSLAFSPSGTTLYASGPHVPLQRYHLTSEHLVQDLCTRAGGGLSRTDWTTYLPNVPYRTTC